MDLKIKYFEIEGDRVIGAYVDGKLVANLFKQNDKEYRFRLPGRIGWQSKGYESLSKAKRALEEAL